jgi:hypothetical protein
MFDFLRELRKSDEERRQEALSAYLDGALTPAEMQRFERQVASDEALQAELEEQRLIKASLSRLPRLRAPRNFTLDPALYGRPVDSTADRLYPVLRVATAVVAILFVVVLVIDLSPIGAGLQESTSIAEDLRPAAESVEAPAGAEQTPLLEPQAEEVAVGEVEIEVTRLVEAEEEAAVEMAAEEPAEAEMAEEEAALAEGDAGQAADEIFQEAPEEPAPPPGPEEASGGGGPPGETPMAMLVPPTEEALTSTAETELAEDRAAGGPTTRSAATASAPAPTEVADLALSDQATVLPTASPAQPALEGSAQAVDDASAIGPETGLSVIQILAISLGALLVLLLAATLLLRQQGL